MDENNARGVKVAAIRKLDQELGIAANTLNIDDFHFITKMRYSARMGQAILPIQERQPWLVILSLKLFKRGCLSWESA